MTLIVLLAGAGFFGIPPEPAGKGGGQSATWSPGENISGALFQVLVKKYHCVFGTKNCEYRHNVDISGLSFKFLSKMYPCVFDQKL